MNFCDTNIFVYAVSIAPEDAEKRERALALLQEADASLSLQVIQEFINTCLNKKRIGQGVDTVLASVRQMLLFPCLMPTPETVFRAVEIHQRYQTNYWDATILAAAQELGCDTLYTEDLNHGQDYDGVKVINPFLE